MAKPSNRNLHVSAAVACLTGALFGYSVGFIGGVLVLPSFLHHFHLDQLEPGPLASARSGTVTAWLLGASIGVPLGVPACSNWGRKSCFTLCAVLYVVGAALQLVDVGGWLALFEAGRVLNGIGVGVGTLVSPM
jgi:MFS family permease